MPVAAVRYIAHESPGPAYIETLPTEKRKPRIRFKGAEEFLERLRKLRQRQEEELLMLMDLFL